MAANASLDPAAQEALPTHLPFWRMMRFTPCEHGPGDLIRLRRPHWMRVLVPNKRLYQCPHCGVRVLYAR